MEGFGRVLEFDPAFFSSAGENEKSFQKTTKWARQGSNYTTGNQTIFYSKLEEAMNNTNPVVSPVFVTDKELAVILGLKLQTLRNYRSMKKGPPFCKLERSIRYSIADAIEWMQKRRIETN